MKIIITGATSFIGQNLIRRLIKEGHFVYAVVRPNSMKAKELLVSSQIKVVELEMHEYTKLDEKINEMCDVYFSLAWEGTRSAERDNHNLQKRNFECSTAALKSIKNLGCHLILSAGSQAEYGLCDDYVKETSIADPVTWYGKYKLKYFLKTTDFCNQNNIAFKEPRFFSLYGPDDFKGTMIFSILDKMLKNESCDLTECKQMWDFLYIDDAIEALISLMERPCEDGIYNLGSGDSRSLREYIEEMYSLSGSNSKLNFGSVPYPATGMVNVMPDIAKLKRQVGFVPKTTFAEGIKRIILEMKGHN
ncbi:nucleoside-diphosphate-sugar epimerase [Lachnospiraceae bacterium PF1-21]|uniref:NAD-dependent epimerase/dehydratase family protein n=1 Tax=Ohessyouella blattaphilus TaxID=2949333 RepID=UPI003E216B47